MNIQLKIGRHEYEITSSDQFMDNGSCVQLLTQSKECSVWGKRPTPVLSKRAVKEISEHKRIQRNHNYGNAVQVFSLNI